MVIYVLLTFFAGCHWSWQIHLLPSRPVVVTSIQNRPLSSFYPSDTKLHYKDILHDDIYYPRTRTSTERRRRLVRRNPRIIPTLRRRRYQSQYSRRTAQNGIIGNKDISIRTTSKNHSVRPNFTRRRIGLNSKTRSVYYHDRSWDDFDERYLVPIDSSASLRADVYSNYAPIPDKSSSNKDVLLNRAGIKVSRRKPSKVVPSTPINEWLPSMTISIMVFYMGILALVA